MQHFDSLIFFISLFKLFTIIFAQSVLNLKPISTNKILRRNVLKETIQKSRVIVNDEILVKPSNLTTSFPSMHCIPQEYNLRNVLSNPNEPHADVLVFLELTLWVLCKLSYRNLTWFFLN